MFLCRRSSRSRSDHQTSSLRSVVAAGAEQETRCAQKTASCVDALRLGVQAAPSKCRDAWRTQVCDLSVATLRIEYRDKPNAVSVT